MFSVESLLPAEEERWQSQKVFQKLRVLNLGLSLALAEFRNKG